MNKFDKLIKTILNENIGMGGGSKVTPLKSHHGEPFGRGAVDPDNLQCLVSYKGKKFNLTYQTAPTVKRIMAGDPEMMKKVAQGCEDILGYMRDNDNETPDVVSCADGEIEGPVTV